MSKDRRKKERLETGDSVANGMLRGIVTGRVSDTEVRVYWNSTNDTHYETIEERYLVKIN